jgi:glucose/arabinose dehydrogenase
MKRPAVFRRSGAVAALCLIAGSTAAADVPELHLESLAADLERIVAVTHTGGERLFITLQGGRVMILEGGEILPQPFLDISDRVRRTNIFDGLLAFAFHPDYPQNGFVYASYVDLAGVSRTVRYRRSGDPDHIDPASERTLIAVEEFPGSIHHVQTLRFGPDGYLYVASGDSGLLDPLCAAQDDLSLEGKLLRIDVDRNVDVPPYYGIPPDNPYAGLDSAREEIWAKGLRNPWSFAFDRETGDLYVADVGQAEREEVNFQPAGAGGRNYGWKSMEGTLCVSHDIGCSEPLPPCDSPGLTSPILEFDHQDGRCAVIGGHVYRGRRIPGLYGVYLFGDWCTGTLWAAERAAGSWRAEELALELPGLVAFGEGPAGEIYLATAERLFRLAGPQLPAPGLLELAATELVARESDDGFALAVRRLGLGSGTVSVDYATRGETATPGSDYREVAGSLIWPDGDVADQDVVVPILDDGLSEAEETLTLTLTSPGGGAILGARATARLTLVDDEPPCVADETHLCLSRERFRVDVGWTTAAGAAGAGRAVRLTPDSGYFWFFDAGNPEVFVKVLDACVEPFDHFWVFAAGLTDVETHLTVLDTASGRLRRYDKPLGAAFQPIRDTTAFATCGQ